MDPLLMDPLLMDPLLMDPLLMDPLLMDPLLMDPLYSTVNRVPPMFCPRCPARSTIWTPARPPDWSLSDR